LKGVQYHRHAPFLGARPCGLDGHYGDQYEWLTYGEVDHRVKMFGSGLRHLFAQPWFF
jgi:hypothetical protein